MTPSVETSRRLGAWIALVAICLCMPACRREEPPETKPSVDPTSPESYMNDKAFLKRAGALRAEQRDLVRARNAIVDKMTKLIEAKKAELKTDDPAKLKAALEAMPEWKDLHAQCVAATKKVEASRAKIYDTVGDRLAPRKTPVQKPASK